MDNKSVHIIGGGTISHIFSHLALCAPAYGGTARKLESLCKSIMTKMDVHLHLTKMAGGKFLETNEDVENLINDLVNNDKTRILFIPAAIVDYGALDGSKDNKRISSSLNPELDLKLNALPKVIKNVRSKRKDIFLVAFKQTYGLKEEEQYIEGLNLCKKSSANLVLANDSKTKLNMVITPEESKYHVTCNREEALRGLVEMAFLRSHLMFTRSTVVSGDTIPWESDLVYPSLRAVVNHCIQKNAYKPFNGSTAGHFACKLDENTFLTSIRKTNFNDLSKFGLVKVITDGPDSVTAYGAKPSVGGQSQRIVFHDHMDYDCIVHFHCPIKAGSQVPVVSQREFECGSHECGKNTSNNLKKFGNLSAVFLDQHGPNVVFNHSIDPNEVIKFIDENFDLSQKTGGFVSIS